VRVFYEKRYIAHRKLSIHLPFSQLLPKSRPSLMEISRGRLCTKHKVML
jgi:hypothetical protein